MLRVLFWHESSRERLRREREEQRKAREMYAGDFQKTTV
jgi:hypothetical protein